MTNRSNLWAFSLTDRARQSSPSTAGGMTDKAEIKRTDEQWRDVEVRARIKVALNFSRGDDLGRIAAAAGVA